MSLYWSLSPIWDKFDYQNEWNYLSQSNLIEVLQWIIFILYCNIEHAHFKKVYETKFIHMIFASFINLPKVLKNIIKSARNSWTLNFWTGANQPKSQILFKKDFTAGLYKKDFGLSL